MSAGKNTPPPGATGCQSGTTMIELLASIVIISIATLGLMLAISSVVGGSADPMIENQASAIAEAYLEEASLVGFCDPDFLNPGETCRNQCTSSVCSGGCGSRAAFQEASRDLFDDVCDYDVITNAAVTDRNGVAISPLAEYSVSVDVFDDGTSLGSPALSANAGQVVRIQVSVNHAELPAAMVLSTYRANAQ